MIVIRLILSILIFLPFFSCTKKEEKIKSGKPTVLVSVSPYAYFVQKIAEDTVDIETLVPAGNNPHIYEATPKEVRRHQNAAVWIYLGESFDKKVLQFFQNTKREILVVDITQGIDLLSNSEEEESGHCCHHHDEGKDLHVWLSPTLAKLQAQKIAAALTSLLPHQQMRFQANLEVFLNELDDLDKQITNLLEPIKGKAILVSHPAFGYFCHDYHLTQLSIETEGKDPLPQHITEILAKAKSYAIQSVLTQPQYSNKGAELLAHTLDLPTHQVDPYAENYSENLLAIAKVIAK
ncbi:MAG: zinc ABC transporter substrate-binding protein [Rhabdochlamydiaceae bacterium]